MSIADWIISRVSRRAPDFIIGADYLRRWWIIPRNRWFNIYLHEIRRDDDDRALHDHPWWNLSIILHGAYREHMPHGTRVLGAGSLADARMAFRRATAAHRISVMVGPVWSLFVTGPRIREWGFHCPQGFVGWEKFTNPGDYGQIGKGCDQ